MRNPEQTRETILKKSGLLFNTQGYKATSISEITEATGLTKGAIYRHFKSKEELELETLIHLSTTIATVLRARIKERLTAPEKLEAVFAFFESYITNPPVKGGCPLMNAAIEADDAHPLLRKGALKMLSMFKESIAAIIDNGIRYKQLKPTIDREYYSTVVFASLEGAIMMSKLQGNNNDMKLVLKHLKQLVKEITL